MGKIIIGIMFANVLILLILLKVLDESNSTVTLDENMSSAERNGGNIHSVEFEVFGHVQGVFFRKYTQKQGQGLGLKGWCMNTESGTVQGVMEGPSDKVQKMKEWLQKTGSPLSKIDHAEFKNEKLISGYNYKDFKIRR